jgi:hypothetical protein
MLYDAGRESRLAFEHPGIYWLKVVFPLTEPQPLERTEIQSDKLRIVVVEPQKSDAEILTRILDKAFLAFLQTGGGAKEIALEAAALVKATPNSAYSSALRQALREYYDGYIIGKHNLDEHEAGLLRSVLGIEAPAAEPFPEDKRLDQIITYHFQTRTPWEDVFKEISQQSGVRLEIDAELRARTMSSLRVTEPLRQFMRNQAAYMAVWEAKGEGYLLRFVPDDDVKK